MQVPIYRPGWWQLKSRWFFWCCQCSTCCVLGALQRDNMLMVAFRSSRNKICDRPFNTCLVMTCSLYECSNLSCCRFWVHWQQRVWLANFSEMTTFKLSASQLDCLQSSINKINIHKVYTYMHTLFKQYGASNTQHNWFFNVKLL